MVEHVVQSSEWGRFKTEYGTKAIRVGDVQYTIHKIPFSQNYMAYAPKVNPFNIKWEELEASLKQNGCFAINFDVPNILKNSEEEKAAIEIITSGSNCQKSPRDTFAKYNILLDISKDYDILLTQMHKKHRYNLNYATKHGVTARKAETDNDFDIFFNLLKETADRQKYYIHPKSYYQKVWQFFKPLGMCHILIAEFENKSLASWMFFFHKNVLYYPYGGSSETHKNLFASTLLSWEGIKLGKSLGCGLFDMWGAAKDPNDASDPWFGFTNFKLKFGGIHVEYIDSYDFILDKNVYNLFNFAQNARWKLLRFLK